MLLVGLWPIWRTKVGKLLRHFPSSECDPSTKRFNSRFRCAKVRQEVERDIVKGSSGAENESVEVDVPATSEDWRLVVDKGHDLWLNLLVLLLLTLIDCLQTSFVAFETEPQVQTIAFGFLLVIGYNVWLPELSIEVEDQSSVNLEAAISEHSCYH